MDVGFDIESKTGRTGAVLRGDRGFFVSTSSRILDDVSNAMTAKATALWDSLSLASSMGCNKLMVIILLFSLGVIGTRIPMRPQYA